MSPNEINMICDRLDRIEDKLDEYTKCTANKIPRGECGEHRDKLWSAINSLRRLVWIGLGIAIASSVFIPLIFSLKG